MSRLGFAIIGTGNISTVHINAIKNIENAELKAIMSHDKNRADEFARKYNVKAYYDIDELLKDNNVNVVDIVSYHDLHVKYAMKSAKAGKHVIVEKPIGTNIEGIDELIESCNKNNVKLTVISQHRLDESLVMAKKRLTSGEFGRILFVNVDLISNKSENYYKESIWRASKKRAGGGVLMMKAIHLIDVLIWIFGDVESVYGKINNIKKDIEVEDMSSALLKFKNGTIVSLHTTNSAEYSYHFRIMIYGEKKSLMIEQGNIIEIDSLKEVNNIFKRIKLAAVNRLPIKINKSRKYKLGSIGEQIKLFVDSIIENNDINLPNALDGKKALEVILAIYKSSNNKKEILINR